MIGRFLENALGGKRNVFLLVVLVVTFAIVYSSYLVVVYVNQQTRSDDEIQASAQEVGQSSEIYVDFFVDEARYISDEAYIAMGDYQRNFPEPQNVQVLTGMSTQAINGYMMNHVVTGMKVNCTYCHNLNNFAADEWGDTEEINAAEERKMLSREHLIMTQDLNRNWLAELPQLTNQKQPSGAAITCATCHNGAAQPVTWPADLQSLPDDFRLPLDAEYDLTLENQGILNVNARDDISLDSVQYNQYVMYHMNRSLNVGCTHCHNSRYFPSQEVPAIHYAANHLQMAQHILQEYGDTLNNKEPSCLMCHQENVVPPGAARSMELIPDALAAPPDDSVVEQPTDLTAEEVMDNP